jgi:proteasome lid subunit RPN8/RPN11
MCIGGDNFFEECWTLVGARCGRVWFARPVRRTAGSAHAVAFDAAWALRREERRRDVVGFLHTHPPGLLRPSRRDIRTMRAWCGAFGKPLLCVIVSGDRAAAFIFVDDESEGVTAGAVEVYAAGVIVLEPEAEGLSHGDREPRQAAPRGAVPWRRQAGQGPRRAGHPVRRWGAGLAPGR